MKLGGDEVLIVPYKCCCFRSDPLMGRPRAGEIGHGGPFFKKLLQTGRLQRILMNFLCICFDEGRGVGVAQMHVYWKEKETHIHFGCYLYQRCMNSVNESLFEMLNIHICTHCDTFLCKKTTSVSHVNGKGDRGYEREIQAVFNNRKEQIFQMPWFWINRHKLKTTECEHQYGARKLCPM